MQFSATMFGDLNGLPVIIAGMPDEVPSMLLFGQLRREYIITPAGRAMSDQPGGNLLHAASGLLLWGDSPGLVARVGEDYPREWLARCREAGCGIDGVRILPEAHDLRSFTAFQSVERREHSEPVKHYARLGLPFPKGLLGYPAPGNGPEASGARSALSLRPEDIPGSYHFSTAAHLCPMDYASHNLIPAALRDIGLTTITLDPGSEYLKPQNWDRVLALLRGLSALLVSEGRLRILFEKRSRDLWEMAAELSEYGPPIVVIRRGDQGQMLFDRESGAKYHIPAYPARVSDPTGAGDAFCGGYLVGYRQTYDPVQAVLQGNISASIAIEGSGIFPLFEGRRRLAAARLESLKEQVRKI